MKSLEQLKEEFRIKFNELMPTGNLDRDFPGIDREILVDFLLSKIKERDEWLEREVANPSYVGVLDSNEKRRGYDIARTEFLSLIKQMR